MATEYRDPAGTTGNDEQGNSVNPASIEGTAIAPEPAGKPRKPRSDAGKPRGPRTGTKAKATASPLDLSGLAGVLVGLTETIAQWRNVPEIGLDPTEAKELMAATQNVLRHYSIETTQKGADFIALFGTLSMIVGTRIAAYNLRIRIEREQSQQRGFRPSVVVPMNGQPQQSQQPQQPSPEIQPHFDDSSSGF